MSDWKSQLDLAQTASADLSAALEVLATFRNESIAKLNAFARSHGVEVDLAAALATFERPYTLVPTGDKNEWYLVSSRMFNVPAVGWIVSQTPAFTVSRITRTMGILSPLPEWVRSEVGWTPPEHDARINPNRTAVAVTRGNRATFQKRYGQFLGKPTADGFQVKRPLPLVVQMVKDGILPHTPKPVAAVDWHDDAKCDIVPRDYQRLAIETFRANGAVSLIAPMGAGKMFTFVYLAAHLRGKSLILAPGTALVEQWRACFAKYAPNARVQINTYQWALAHLKELQKQQFAFLGMDELHRVPANEFSKLAYLPADYRAGATGTPWREDDRTPLIVALAGPPAGIPWAELIGRGILHRPRVVAEIVNGDSDKTREVKRLLEKHAGTRAIVFCDSIDAGKNLARALDLPFVHGETRNQLAIIQASPHCIISRVGDYGLDLTDLTLVVEYDFLGKSRVQSAQRMGRLMHSQKKGEHVTLFTLEEYRKFGDRLLGIQSELGDIEVLDLTGVLKHSERAEAQPRRVRSVSRAVAEIKPGDEIGAALASKAIARLILDFESKLGRTRQGYMARAFRILWQSDGTSEELRLRDGKSVKSWEPYQAGLNMLVKAGLAKLVDKRYFLDRARVNALKG